MFEQPRPQGSSEKLLRAATAITPGREQFRHFSGAWTGARRNFEFAFCAYRLPAAALAEFAFRLKKHSRQYTGRPCVGLNGTVVSRPH
jgi:hypothetical protein